MTARLSVVVFGIVLLVGVRSSYGHHAFEAEFDANKPVTLTGTLTKMEWVNPHGWIHIDVKGPEGKVVSWAIETGSPNALVRRGLRLGDFPIGSTLVVEGYRARNGGPVANGRIVRFADGRNFFMGSSGVGAPTDGAEDKPKGRGTGRGGL
jgi:hypothetical protein